MEQYWMKVKYIAPVGGDNPCWELTRGRFRNETAVRNAHAARAKSLDYEILEVKPYDYTVER